MHDDPRLVRRAERVEADATASILLAAPPPIGGALGLELHAWGGAVATFAASADVLALNRVIGLGVHAPATEAGLDRLIGAARDAGVPRLFVQLVPGARPQELPRWIEARGGRPHNRWVRLWRATTDLPERVPTDLRIAELDTERAMSFARIVRSGFGMPDLVDPWFASVVGRPGWRHFAALDGNDIVAGGMLYAAHGTAWLGFASTLATHRGRGAQGALIARRLREAAALGCDWAVTETAEPLPDRPAPSHANMLRLGFTEAYRRQNYTLTLGGEGE